MTDESEEMKFQLDGDGVPNIPRFTINIPKEIRHEFVRDMQEEVRSPSDMVGAVLVKWYRRKRAEATVDQMRKDSNVSPLTAPPRYFGPKPETQVIDQEKRRSGDEG